MSARQDLPIRRIVLKDRISMAVEDASGRVEHLLTLEVRGGQRQIIQARGQSNRLPIAEELRVLALWGESGGPSLSRWASTGPPCEIEPEE